MYFGAAYYPEFWPEARWAVDARMMQKAGVNGVRMAEFAWSALEPEEGRYDFDWLDRAVAAATKWAESKSPEELATPLPDGPIMGGAPRSEPIAVFRKFRVTDLGQDLSDRLLNQPVQHGRDAQDSGSPAGLRNLLP